MQELDYQQNKELLEFLPAGVRLFTLFDNHVPWARFSRNDLEALGDAMSRISMQGGASALAGYTYLGQFLAHDLSRLRLGSHTQTVMSLTLDKLHNSDVTPTLDLSNVYEGAVEGSELRVAGSAYMDLGAAQHKNGSLLHGYDLPRKNRRACIADHRNDENLIVSQLHVQFLRLHNFFVDIIQAEQPSLATEALFAAARTQVVQHYQEVILYDFLYEILHPDVWNAIILQDKSILWNPVQDEEAVLPVEFSAAAGRFGHAMVRDNYDLNKHTHVKTAELFSMTGDGRFGSSEQYRQLPATHLIDWLLYFSFPSSVTRFHFNKLNKSRKISPRVRVDLKHTGTLSEPDVKNLATRNLIRGSQMGLGSGQDAASYIQSRYSAQLKDCGITIRLLSKDELNLNKPGYQQNVLESINPQLCESTPLWFYLLAEASVETIAGIGKLGPLGSLIMAESIKGLLKLDARSVFHSPARRTDITPTKFYQVHPSGRCFLQMSDLILAVNPGLPDPVTL